MAFRIQKCNRQKKVLWRTSRVQFDFWWLCWGAPWRVLKLRTPEKLTKTQQSARKKYVRKICLITHIHNSALKTKYKIRFALSFLPRNGRHYRGCMFQSEPNYIYKRCRTILSILQSRRAQPDCISTSGSTDLPVSASCTRFKIPTISTREIVQITT